jgi:hypothetical protein
MDSRIIEALRQAFEKAMNRQEKTEYWLARDLQVLLDYDEWRNFGKVVDDMGFARIRSKRDAALFGGPTTSTMKKRLGVPDARPLADFLPTVTIKAKDLATEMINFNVKKNDLQGEIILYTTEDGQANIRLKAEGGAVWLNQAAIAELFQTSKQNISLHIQNILGSGELTEEATVKESLTVQAEGGRQVQRKIAIYNLDTMLAIGYRVSSPRGVQVRRWATSVLKEYLVKGFAMDDARLRYPGEHDYFDEILERIRDIRASEKRFYQKVLDIYATAVDYDPTNKEAA